MTQETGTQLGDTNRNHVRISVWLMLGAAVVALVGIFGFGGLTGAGDYFSSNDAVSEAALRDHYWQIWGILLPIAVAIMASGVALFLLSGVLARMGTGWPVRVTTVVRGAVMPLTLVAAVPYLLGPDVDGPSWLEPIAGIAGVGAYLATAAMGVAIFGLPLPTWTGIALIVGAVVALVSFLPLFVFVGTLVAGIGMLRWDRKAEALAGLQPAQ